MFCPRVYSAYLLTPLYPLTLGNSREEPSACYCPCAADLRLLSLVVKCTPAASQDQHGASDPLELEVEAVVSHQTGAGIQTWIL